MTDATVSFAPPERLDLGSHGRELILDARHIGECNIDLVLAQEARPALAEGHRPAAPGGPLHLAQHVHEDQDQKQRRSQLQQELS